MLRQINITPVLNGFIVQVGCQQLAYTSITKLCGDLHGYLHAPDAQMKAMLEEFINRKHTHGHDPDFTMPPVAVPGACGIAVPVPAQPMPPTHPYPATACGTAPQSEPTAERWNVTVTAPRGGPATAEQNPDPRFTFGQNVAKRGGDYRYRGEVRSVCTKRSGEIRYLVENADGQLHIFNENQLQPEE